MIEKPSPRISFEKTVHNFGELGIKEKGKCEFKFKNIGTALLKIGEITASCGCTVPTLSKKEYQPGEEGIIEVKYKGKSKPGPVAEFILSGNGKALNRSAVSCFPAGHQTSSCRNMRARAMHPKLS